MAEPDGTIGHAEVRIGDSMLELSDGGEAWPARPAAIHVYVPDADAIYARAVAAGAAVADRADGHALRRPRGRRHRPVRQQLVHRDPQGGRSRAAGARHAHAHAAREGHRPPDRLHQAGLRSGGARPHARAGRHRRARPAQAGRLGAGAGRGARHRAADALLDPLLRGGRGPRLRERAARGSDLAGRASNRPYGDRAAEVADPFGNHWFIATHVEDVRYR